MAEVAGLRQRHLRQWPALRHLLQLWPGLRHLRQWRGPPHRRSVRLPRHSVQPWSRTSRRVSPHRRDHRPHRALQRHDPRSIVRRRSDRP
jgi:hypothetical protein